MENKTVTVGDKCNWIEDCKQCGDCDWFIYCNKTTDLWTKGDCDVEEEADGSIFLDKKLFWKLGNETDVGGHCAPWKSLKPDEAAGYRANGETCKEICKVEGDSKNARLFHYTEPDIDNNIWRANPVPLCCEEGTRFDDSKKQCVLCRGAADCNADCPY